MFERVEKLYMSDYAKRSFVWRWLCEIANNLVDTDIDLKFIPSRNPLRWCLMDLINLCYLFLIGLIMYLALPIFSAFDAIYFKKGFEGDNFDHFRENVIVPW